jgi:N-acyl-D-amino-acid deacylase
MNKDFDILILGGTVYDGSGNPGVRADVAVLGDKIALVGNSLEGRSAEKVIDAEGLAVAPGFIDPHSHTDVELLVNPRAESKVRQGVTTEIAGNCGFTTFPLNALNFEKTSDYLKEKYNLDLNWSDVETFFLRLRERGMAVNYATLVGHGNIRGVVLGMEDRLATEDEIGKMRAIIREHMEAGVFGLSSGLIYTPGCYADREEIIALCREVAQFNGIYATHMRNESDSLIEAVEESIHVAEESKVSLQISHIKLAYPRNWPKVHQVLSRVSQVAQGGLKIMADRYPYIATSTFLSVLMPPWLRKGSTEEYLCRLKDPQYDALIQEHVKDQELRIGSWETIRISSVVTEENRRFIGKTIEEAAKAQGKPPYEFIRDLLVSEKDQVEMINFSLNEDSFRQIIVHPLVVIGSDGWALAPYGPLGRSKPHPRSYGTFPRILGRYVREENILTLGEAIRKMTSQTASKFGIPLRGWLREGFFADLVVFDPRTVSDRATWDDPHQYPQGILHVIVNGKAVIEDGSHTGRLPGRILRKEKPVRLVY